MKESQVTDNHLVLEVSSGAEAEGERPRLRLRSLSQEQDGETTPGAVVVWPAEMRRLVAALAEAAGELAGGLWLV